MFNFGTPNSDFQVLDTSKSEEESLQLQNEMKGLRDSLKLEVNSSIQLFSIPGREGESFFIENGKIVSKNWKLADAVSYEGGTRVAVKHHDPDGINNYEPNLYTMVDNQKYKLSIKESLQNRQEK